MLGEILGNYVVISELGRGGMGAVYLAEHALIKKKVAVKILLPQYSVDPEIVERFFNEARAATQIHHPGIVEIFDFGYHTNGCAFLVMEYLKGQSLAAHLSRSGNRLPEPRLLEIARQLASALRAAHAQGIIHRDLKPDNAYLVPDGDLPFGIRVKVLDFGIAKLSRDSGSFKTRTGVVMGTPAYMSPEQCRGAGAVDARSDVYSLACMMFEMASGQVPFEGDGPGDTIGAHIYSPVPKISALMPNITAGLDALITRMLQKSPDARPRSMSEVILALEALGAAKSAPELLRSLSSERPVSDDAPTDREVPTTNRSTTLGSAASEAMTTPQKRVSPWFWMAPAVIVAVAGGAAWSLLRTPPAAIPSGPPSPIEMKPPMPAATPQPVVTQLEVPPPPRVHFGLDSKPTGAEIFRAADGARVGKTPFTETRDSASGEAVYLVKLHGYRDARVSLPLDRDLDRVIALDKTSSHPSKKTAGDASGSKSGKPAGNGVYDPFEN